MKRVIRFTRKSGKTLNAISDELEKETCNECIENLQYILSKKQLKKFEKVFYSVADKYIFK